jgi:hypothetical protein
MLAMFGVSGDDLQFWCSWLFLVAFTIGSNGNYSSYSSTLQINRKRSTLREETIAFSCDDKSLFA